MAYRANVTDKEQADIESAANDSAERLQWFNGQEQQTGETKHIRALDLQAQGSGVSPTMSAQRQFGNSGHVIGSHNDKPTIFATPGKA